MDAAGALLAAADALRDAWRKLVAAQQAVAIEEDRRSVQRARIAVEAAGTNIAKLAKEYRD